MSDAKTAGRQMENSKWLERLVRVGLVAFGIVHLLVAYLALQLAFGQSEGAPSQQGALQQVAEQSFGTVLLWVIALGFLALAIWQFFEALWGHRSLQTRWIRRSGRDLSRSRLQRRQDRLG
jgi:sterol desaturase/sphingolipid hydroxylase (fatty acid hydroxylase superfamily)